MSSASAPSADAPKGRWILVLNAGSSSLKFAVFAAAPQATSMPDHPSWGGRIEDIGGSSCALITQGAPAVALRLDDTDPHADALRHLLAYLQARPEWPALSAVAHRVVHGGPRFTAAARITPDVFAELSRYVPLAPLHQPYALRIVERVAEVQPALPQFASFDTAFHATLAREERTLPLPASFWHQGLRRYGFHGISYASIAHSLAERFGQSANAPTVVAHLGSGASLCAIRDLRSVATTMGFSALDGLMMGTRPGALDAGVVLHLLRADGSSPDSIERLLYRECGLRGVSGLSGDVRELLRRETEHEGARLALTMYVRSIVREIGAMAATLGGLDRLVFTGGVGENNAEIRRRVCARLGWLGVLRHDATPDEASDAERGRSSLARNGIVDVQVIATREEWWIAQEARALLHGE